VNKLTRRFLLLPARQHLIRSPAPHRLVVLQIFYQKSAKTSTEAHDVIYQNALRTNVRTHAQVFIYVCLHVCKHVNMQVCMMYNMHVYNMHA